MTTTAFGTRLGRRDVLRLGAAAALAGAAGVGTAPAARAQTLPMLDIKFSLNAPKDGSNAAFIHALQKGYFRDEGLNPSLTRRAAPATRSSAWPARPTTRRSPISPC